MIATPRFFALSLLALATVACDAGKTSPGTLPSGDSAANASPVATDDALATDEEVAATITFAQVLSNDTDLDGDALSVSLVDTTSQGGATVTEDGTTITYTPVADFAGEDSFTYTADDGRGGTSVGTVVVTVANVADTPVAVADSVTGDEDVALAILVSTLTANDTDGDGDTLAISAADAASAEGGTVSFDATTVTYTPAADYNGTDTFDYTVNDGNGGTASTTVTVTVAAVNDLPTFTKGGNLDIAEDAGAQTDATWATGMSAGPADESGQTLSFVLSSDDETFFAAGPSVDAAGNLTYTPADHAHGTVTVTAALQDDGTAPRASAGQSFTIDISPINDPPTFTPVGNQRSSEDAGPQSVTAWATDITAGPWESGQTPLTFTVTDDNAALFATAPTIGTDGTLTYEANANMSGSAVVTVTLRDTGGGDDTSAPITFTITVQAVNDAPSFTKGADIVVLEDSSAATRTGWASNMSAGPADESVQDSGLYFTLTHDAPGAFAVEPAITAAGGDLSFTPAADANGLVTVSVVFNDGQSLNGASAAQTFTIDMTAINDTPTFVAGGDQSVTEDSGMQTVSTWATVISAGAANELTQTLTFIVTHERPGLFSADPAIDPVTGDLTYESSPNGEGVAIISVVLQDDATFNTDSILETFTITITGVNDDPTANDDFTTAPRSTAQGQVNQISFGAVLANDTDPDVGDTLTVTTSASTTALGAAVSRVAGNFVIDYAAVPGVSGADSFTYTIEDGAGVAPSTATVSLAVEPDTVAPTFNLAASRPAHGDILSVEEAFGGGSQLDEARFIFNDANLDECGSSEPGEVSVTFKGTPLVRDVDFSVDCTTANEIRVTFIDTAPGLNPLDDVSRYGGFAATGDALAFNLTGVVDVAGNAGAPVLVQVIYDQVAPTMSHNVWGDTVSAAHDFELYFSEAMDTATVAPAFSLTDSAGKEPQHGYVFFWGAGDQQTVVMPDTTDPAATVPADIRNDDILLDNEDYAWNVTVAATDVAGNGIVMPESRMLHTWDHTTPILTAILTTSGTDALTALVPQSDVGPGGTLDFVFNESMVPYSGSISLRGSGPEVWASIESREVSTATGRCSAEAASVAIYETSGNHYLSVGDEIRVVAVNTADLNTDGPTAVLAVLSPTSFKAATVGCTDAVENWNGWALLPPNPDASGSLAWVDTVTLRLTLAANEPLQPGDSYSLDMWSVRNVGGSSARSAATLQIENLSDVEAPLLLATLPADGDSGAALASPIFLVFSEPVDAATLAGVTLAGAAVDTADFERMYPLGDDMRGVVAYLPLKALPGGTVITVEVPDAIADFGGNPLLVADSIVFSTRSGTDSTAPQVKDIVPPPSVALTRTWSLAFSLSDGDPAILGAPRDLISATSVDMGDIHIVDDATGLPRRGWVSLARSGGSDITFYPIYQGLDPGGTGYGVVSVLDEGPTLLYQTNGPHGFVAGDSLVSGDINVTEYNVRCAVILKAGMVDGLPSDNHLQIADMQGGGYPMGSGGWLGVESPKTYTATLGSGSSFVDYSGNAFAPVDFTFIAAPRCDNGPPLPDGISSLGLSGVTSATGRSLSGEMRVSDSDNDPYVRVSVTGPGIADHCEDESTLCTSATDCAAIGTGACLPGWHQVVSTSGNNDVRLNNDGPPSGQFENMNDANLPTSGYYRYTISLDDLQGAANSVLTYERDVWVWRPDAAPQLESVDSVAVNRLSPVRISASTPTVQWSGTDQINADYQQLFILDMGAIDGDMPGYRLQAPLSRGQTSFTIPDSTPLPIGLYLWAVNEAKSPVGFDRAIGEAWALDMASGLCAADMTTPCLYDPDCSAVGGICATGLALNESLFLYGPDNNNLNSQSYGVSRFSFEAETRWWPPSFAGSESRQGTFDFDGSMGVDPLTTSNAGVVVAAPTSYFYALDATSGEILITQRASDGAFSFPAPGRGTTGMWYAVGGSGGAMVPGFFATVNATSGPLNYLMAGGHRYQTTGYVPSDVDGSWVFVQMEMELNNTVAPPDLMSMTATMGHASASASTLTVTIDNEHDGTPPSPNVLPAPMTVSDAGLVAIDLGLLRVGLVASGYLGGPGSADVLVASGNDVDLPYFLLALRERSLATLNETDLSGDYGVAVLGVGVDSSGPGPEVSFAFNGQGTVNFTGAPNGDGTADFAFDLDTTDGPIVGIDTYSVNSGGNGLIVLNSEDGTPIHLLASGSNLDVLIGISIGDANFAQVVIATRR